MLAPNRIKTDLKEGLEIKWEIQGFASEMEMALRGARRVYALGYDSPSRAKTAS